MTSSIEETLRLIQLTLEKVMQTCENVEKCTLIIYLAAHIYIVAVLHSLFISHILVFLVLIIQHIVPKIYTLGAKCSFYGVKCMKKELSVFINRTLYNLVPGSDCDVFSTPSSVV